MGTGTGITENTHGLPTLFTTWLCLSTTGIRSTDVKELHSKVCKFGNVCEQQLSSRSNSLPNCSVIVEDKLVVLFGKRHKESEDVGAVVSALPFTMWESKGNCHGRLAPCDEPVTG
jgi:hypothetical protein